MEFSFFVKCFLIGVLAASGCGPIFVLTFNRSAICGFWKGFASALGASIGDAFYFFLGLLGALAVVSELQYFILFLDLIGGLVLLALGAHALKRMRQMVCVTIECSYGYLLSIGKSLTLTLVNPLVILFFIAISIQVLPEDIPMLPFRLVVLCSLLVMIGSLTVLSAVAFAASYVGSCITAKRLRIISGITGLMFIIFGFYLLGDFTFKMAKKFLVWSF